MKLTDELRGHLTFTMPPTSGLDVTMTESGEVMIYQEDVARQDDGTIYLTLDQVPVLIGWLERIMAALRTDSAGSS